jgi:integrase
MLTPGQLASSTIKAHAKKAVPCRLADGGNLFFEITKAGRSQWMMRYTSPITNKRREPTLSKYPEMGLAEARERATRWRALIADGKDPMNEREKQQREQLRTVNDIWENYYSVRTKQIKSHKKELSLYLREIQPVIGHIPAFDLEPLLIQRILNNIAHGANPRPTVANDALWLMKNIFNHAIKLGQIKYNPASAFTPKDAGGKELHRKRNLSIDEISKLFLAIDNAGLSFSRENNVAVVLLLILGTRKMELLAAKWTEFKLELSEWHKPFEDDNNKKQKIIIPLDNYVLILLEELKVLACGSAYLFPARMKSKKPHVYHDTLNHALNDLNHGLPHFTVHDLRRTCRTMLASLGFSREISERYINHKLKGMEAIYNQHDYFDERAEAQRELISHLRPAIDSHVIKV